MRLYFNEIAVSCRAPNVVSRQMARIDGHTGLACAALIVLLAVLSLTSVDHDLALAIRGVEFSPRWAAFLQRFTYLGNSEPALSLSAAGTFIALLITRFAPVEWRDIAQRVMIACALVFVVVALTGVAAILLKQFFGRPRPVMFLEQGVTGFHFFVLAKAPRLASFPSGHATTAFALATLVWLSGWRWRGLAIVVLVAVAMSRVILLQHYLSDVLAGALVGTVGALAICRLALDLQARRAGRGIDSSIEAESWGGMGSQPSR